MSVAVITPPEPLVELELAKAHLRVDHDDDDALIEAFIAAASADLDGPEGWMGRALGMQTLELRQDGFLAQDWQMGAGRYAWDGVWTGDAWGRWPFRRIVLPYPPFVQVVSITYEGLDGTDQVLGPDGWQASDEGVAPAFGLGWPSGRIAANAVRIRYRAGYETPPPRIQVAVLMTVASLYANREASVIDARAVVAANPAVEALLAPYRVYRV